MILYLLFVGYHVPPLTFPLVAMAEVERPVIPVIQEDNKMITQVIPEEEGQFKENVTDIKTRTESLFGATYSSLSSDPRQS